MGVRLNKSSKLKKKKIPDWAKLVKENKKSKSEQVR
jgi:hypothetical protein